MLENINACNTPTVLETNTCVTETSVVLLCGRAVTERRKSEDLLETEQSGAFASHGLFCMNLPHSINYLSLLVRFDL